MAYDTHKIAILRPRLTDFKGPLLTVRKEDEVARFADPARFDNSRFDEGDSTLYLWRLRAVRDGALRRLNGNALFGEEVLQLALFEHLSQDVAAADDSP